MSESLLTFLIVGCIFCFILVTIYGAALIITEHFWIGVILLFLLPPIFFIWAFFRGLIGKRNDTINY